MLHVGNLATYKASRVEPVPGKNGMNGNQIFRRPTVSVMFSTASIVGASVTADNTSASNVTPGLFKPIKSRLKMSVPPSWRVPLLGGKRYVALRESYGKTAAQPQPTIEEGLTVVSGIAVATLHRSLLYRHPDQILTAYLADGDPLDQSMVDLTKALGMLTTEVPGTLKGYTESHKTLRAAKRVGDVMEAIEGMAGADVIERIPVIRISIGDVREQQKNLRRKLAREAQQRDEGIWETRDWRN